MSAQLLEDNLLIWDLRWDNYLTLKCSVFKMVDGEKYFVIISMYSRRRLNKHLEFHLILIHRQNKQEIVC